MTSQDTTKKYPSTTSEVAKMFNILSDHGLLSSQSSTNDLPVAHLPVERMQGQEPVDVQATGSKPDTSDEAVLADVAAAKKTNLGKLSGISKTLLPYVVVFTVGLFAYYFFFSKVDFTKLFKFTPKQAVTAKESALSTLEKQNLSGYQNWIAGFYFDVSDVAAIDPNADSSGNGLTNFQKYLLQLNPKSYDTLGLGMADSETIAAGINPLTGGKLTDDQKQIVDKYFDMEVIMNRLTLANMEKSKPVINSYASDTGYVSGTGGQVAGIGIRGSNTGVYRSFDTGVAYTGGSAQNNSLGLGQLDQVDINTDIPGRLEIPDLKINVPIIWSKTTSDFENDLRNGVVHYPGTALPGQIGTTYISGHSSNYAWAKGSYNQIFSKLGNLAVNTSFKVTVVQKNGKDAGLHYVVTGSKQFKATDQEQFKNAGKSVVTLSTCWPVGSTAKRLVVFGELTQVEKD